MENSNQVNAIQGKQGHFAKCCKTKETKSPQKKRPSKPKWHKGTVNQMNFEDYSVEEKWLYAFTIVDEKQPVGLVNIGGVPIVSMIVDWGASCYVIDRELWESLRSGVEAEWFESWYLWFLSFLPQWFIIPTRIQIYDSRRLLITYWLNDFLRGNLVSFSILWCSNFCFIQTWYHHSFCLDMECFCNWTLSTSLLEKRADCQPQMHELYRGSRGMFPRKKFLKIGLSETPYSAVPGSNAINSCVHFVELFSESRYSWLEMLRLKQSLL